MKKWITGRTDPNHGLEQYPCNLYHLFMLGSSGGALLPLWIKEKKTAKENVRTVLAQSVKQENTSGKRI